MAWFTYINKRQSDFAIWQQFYFHETSYLLKISKFTVNCMMPVVNVTKAKASSADGSIELLIAF